MLLNDLISKLEYERIYGNTEIEILDIQYNSNTCINNTLFFCLVGSREDGHNYINDAINKGAIAVVIQKELKEYNPKITYIKVEDSRKFLAEVSSKFFDYPSEKIKLIGITGTNGKTTTSYVLKSILEKANIKCGLIGTISNHINNKVIPTKNTTPESLELNRLFYEMVKENCEYCIMEVSSHSIAMNRVRGLKFEISLFTNLTIDHQDFHKTMENYFNTKLELFKNSNYSVINVDSDYGKEIIKRLYLKNPNKYQSFSIKNIKTNYINKEDSKRTINQLFELEENLYEINLPGKYNLYNALGAIAISKKIGISTEIIKEGIKNVTVPGRFQCLKEKHNLPFEVIIDFAHTPDGLENLLRTTKAITKNKLIAVYGCGGDKDKKKRAKLGEIGTKLSDKVIITSDNPRDEKPLDIIYDITAGIKKRNYMVIENRKEAIYKALKIANSGDVVILAGKGHEKVQYLQSETIPFDEEKIVLEFFKDENTLIV